MNPDAWLHTLQSIDPSYFKWKDLVENGPKVRARLHRVNLGWRVRIEEDWSIGDVGDQYYTADYSNLDKRCEWAEGQLKNWKSATRLSHQEWKFSDRKQAEKFLIMFNLVWAE